MTFLAVTATYVYDVFGAVKSSTGPGSTEFRFTGQQDDPTVGYQYLRARYYDPVTGRFISKDPLKGALVRPDTQNAFAYVSANPTNLTDPSGMCALGIFGKNCSNARKYANRLDVAAAAFSVLAIAADVTGFGAPVGLVLGGISAGLSVAAAFGHCAQGTTLECVGAIAVAGISIATAGTGTAAAKTIMGASGFTARGMRAADLTAKGLGLVGDFTPAGFRNRIIGRTLNIGPVVNHQTAALCA